jgi:thiamine biosynthesis lipoprotein
VSAPSAVPTAAFAEVGVTTAGLWHSSFRAMASPIRVQLGGATTGPGLLQARVRALFVEVERQCTRFDAASDLTRANTAGDHWQEVGTHCYAALRAAADAHVATGGRFDPRVLSTLVDLGYGSSLAFADGDVRLAVEPCAPRVAPAAWRPGFDSASRVRIGPDPVDLGGIGKGLTLRWTAELLREAGCATFLVDAGGDCVFAGAGPDGSGWRIGVEDPAGGRDPVAVLQIDDGACATSSTRLRSWHAGGRPVHHLIDPSTGAPGGAGLAAVTVVDPDPATAEVWSKVLFLHGPDIADAAKRHQIAALWVRLDGTVGTSADIQSLLCWQRS